MSDLIPRIERLDPEADAVFPADAVPERLAGGFVWTEGPVYVPARRRVVFSDVRANRTWAWTDEQQLEPEEHPSHHQNGHVIDAEGRLVACSHGRRALLRQEADGSWTTLADSFEGRRLSSPNDVTLHTDGSLWFTDPTYGIDKPEEGYGGEREQPGNFVYRLSPDGELTAPIRDRSKPNGIESVAEDRILLADTGDAVTYAYRVDPMGTATLEREWFRVSPGKTDGLRADEAGRIFSSAGDGVHVLSGDGTRTLAKVLLPETAANLCFGGRDGRELFITATDALWRVPVLVRGRWQRSA